MSYQNYAGAWLTQSDASYDWLANPNSPVQLGNGVDTIKIWQSYTLPAGDPNLIVFGDGQYAAGNSSDNVIIANARNNLLYGGTGDDVFVGDGQNTTFIVAQGEGDKVIQNFTENSDTLRLIGGPLTSFSAVQQAMTQRGADVTLNDGGTMILFRNATVGQFQAKDFQLPLAPAALGALTFSEDFDNPATIGTNWQTNFGYGGLSSYTLTNNAEQELYTSPSFTGSGSTPLGLNPFSFANGVLTISANPVTAAQSSQMWGYHYSSGMLESNFTQTYGYFEMRAALPHGDGLWPAFWLLGSQNKEIDVLEGLGSDTKTAYNAVHSPLVPSLGNASFNPYDNGFHTYGLLWTPQTLTYYIDGSPVWQTQTPSDMNVPMHLIVNLAVGGNWPGSPDASTPWPANMQVDYVHAYALANAAAPPPTSPPPPVSPPPVSPPPPPAGGGQVLASTTNFPGSVLIGGSGNDTLEGGQGSDTMTGGAGADTFVWARNPWSPGHVTDFQPGLDKLDVSGVYTNGYQGTDPLGDHYAMFVSDGHGGTAVLIDPDGPAGGAAYNYVVDLEGVAPVGLTSAQVFGGSGAVSPPPAPPPSGVADQVLTSTTNFPGSVLTGGAGNDTLNAGQGSDTLSGGAGGDHFVFATTPWAPAEITDFQHGQDVIDLRGMFAGSGYTGSDPVADHRLTLLSDGAGGTKVLIGSNYFLHVDNVAPSTFAGADWITH